MRRLFIAIEPPENVKKKIEDNVLPSIRKYVTGSFVTAKKMHITLLFLGDFPMSDEELVDKLKKLHMRSDILHLNGVGAFPSLKRPKVVFMHAVDGLDKIHSELGNAFSLRDDYDYTPHLTLCRVNTVIKSLDDVNDAAGDIEIPFKADGLRLFDGDSGDYRRLY